MKRWEGRHCTLTLERPARRQSFAHISMLTGSPFIKLTAKFVSRFAELEDVMRLYTDPAAFDAALAAAIASAPNGNGSRDRQGSLQR